MAPGIQQEGLTLRPKIFLPDRGGGDSSSIAADESHKTIYRWITVWCISNIIRYIPNLQHYSLCTKSQTLFVLFESGRAALSVFISKSASRRGIEPLLKGKASEIVGATPTVACFFFYKNGTLRRRAPAPHTPGGGVTAYSTLWLRSLCTVRI